jgi:microcystin degradation protein MlrC
MIAGKPKVLVGQIFHEGNSFNARLTGEVDFVIYRGADIMANCAGNGSTLGGILDALNPADVQINPSIAACASPGGPVEQGVWENLRDELLTSVRQAMPDLILLDLHGAMVATGSTDPEGELLLALRDVTGPDVLIGVGLDLHGHITDEMCEAANVLVACKNNPHDDYHAAGQRVAQICLDTLAGRVKPVLSRVRIPMILFGNDETSEGPLHDLNRIARDSEAKGALDVSIFTVQAMLDVPDIGQVITAVTDGAPAVGALACGTLARHLLARASEFKTDHLPVDGFWEVLKRKSEKLPFAVSDFGDRVLAGAAGDSVEILRGAYARKDIRAAIPVTDPQAARALRNHAIGETVQMTLGGSHSQVTQMDLTATVELHHNGQFKLAGPWLAGSQANHGLTTVLRANSLAIIVTERPAYSQDTNFFASLGLQIETLDFVVCKSGFHFKLSFAGKAIPLVLGTNGAGRYDPRRTGLQRKPVWPEIPELPVISAVRHFS